MAKCLYCGELHDRKGDYCSDSCKQKAYRRRTVTPTVTVEPPSVTVEGKSVTVSEVDRRHQESTERRKYVPPVYIKPKRGKDIKCFADLPPDVQKSIDMMSIVDGKIDKTIKANRTAIAIDYQQDYNGVCTEAWRTTHGR